MPPLACTADVSLSSLMLDISPLERKLREEVSCDPFPQSFMLLHDEPKVPRTTGFFVAKIISAALIAAWFVAQAWLL